MLSSYPKKTKYNIGDRPYAILPGTVYLKKSIYVRDKVPGYAHENERTRGYMTRLFITGWRAEVTEVNHAAVQINYYKVKKIAGYHMSTKAEEYILPEFEIEESKLYSSQNHLLSMISGQYLNPSCNGDSNGSMIFRHNGMISENQEIIPVAFDDWADLAGMDFRYANFKNIQNTGQDISWGNTWYGGTVGINENYPGGEYRTYLGQSTVLAATYDNTNFSGARLISSLETRKNFRRNARSYDEFNTIFMDGKPIGRGCLYDDLTLELEFEPNTGKVTANFSGISGATKYYFYQNNELIKTVNLYINPTVKALNEGDLNDLTTTFNLTRQKKNITNFKIQYSALLNGTETKKSDPVDLSYYNWKEFKYN